MNVRGNVHGITEKLLKRRGYKRIHSSWFGPHSDFQYQKRITDENGTKYFINPIHYPAGVRAEIEESWTAELNSIKPHYTFQMHGVHDLDDVEEKMETFWRASGCQYYKLNYRENE